MPCTIIKFIATCFKLICFGLAGYTAFLQFREFRENEDASAIAYREYNTAKRDQYPTFSLCFKGYRGLYSAIYKAEFIYPTKDKRNIFSSTTKSPLRSCTPQKNPGGKIVLAQKKATDYQSMLSGRTDIKEYYPPLSSIDFDNATIKMEELVGWFQTITANGSIIDEWNSGRAPGSENMFPFYLSYQDPTQICYTRKITHHPRMKLYLHEGTINYNLLLSQLGECGKKYSRMYIYTHYPGELIKSFRKETTSVDMSKIGKSNNTLTLSISQVSVLRRRPNANAACDPDLQDETNKFVVTIVEKIGCVPPYWNSFSFMDAAIPNCNTTKQLQDIYHEYTTNNIMNTYDVQSLYNPACNEMTLTATVGRTSNIYAAATDLHIQLRYLEEKYQEITNTRAFGLKSLWSGIGGFLGIFVGYSLLQTPELLQDGYTWLLRK